MPIKNSVRRCRFDADEMTQQQLADRLGVSRQTIISIESGKYQPSLELAFKLAQTFGKRVDEIFVFVDGVSA
ncbi:MAG: helix-turn-helix transcriptional regulator [Armatimonadaceae bacterium]